MRLDKHVRSRYGQISMGAECAREDAEMMKVETLKAQARRHLERAGNANYELGLVLAKLIKVVTPAEFSCFCTQELGIGKKWGQQIARVSASFPRETVVKHDMRKLVIALNARATGGTKEYGRVMSMIEAGESREKIAGRNAPHDPYAAAMRMVRGLPEGRQREFANEVLAALRPGVRKTAAYGPRERRSA